MILEVETLESCREFKDLGLIELLATIEGNDISTQENIAASIELASRKWQTFSTLFRAARHHSVTAGVKEFRHQVTTFNTLTIADKKIALRNAKKLWHAHGELLQNLIDNGVAGRRTALPTGVYRHSSCIAVFELVGNWDTGFCLASILGTLADKEAKTVLKAADIIIKAETETYEGI